MPTTKAQCQVSPICTHKSLKQETINAHQGFCWTSSSCTHRCFSDMDTVNRIFPVSQGHSCFHWPAYKGQSCRRPYIHPNSHTAQGHACTQATCFIKLSLNPQILVFQGVTENAGASLARLSSITGPSCTRSTCTDRSQLHKSVPAANGPSHSRSSCTHGSLSHETLAEHKIPFLIRPTLHSQAPLHEIIPTKPLSHKTIPVPMGSCCMRKSLQPKAKVGSSLPPPTVLHCMTPFLCPLACY